MGITVHLDASRRVKIDVGYRVRVRSFSSVEPLDVAHNGRSDRRHGVKAELDLRIARGVHATFLGVYTTQRLNRELDLAATGDIAAYSASVASVGLRFSR